MDREFSRLSIAFERLDLLKKDTSFLLYVSLFLTKKITDVNDATYFNHGIRGRFRYVFFLSTTGTACLSFGKMTEISEI